VSRAFAAVEIGSVPPGTLLLLGQVAMREPVANNRRRELA